MALVFLGLRSRGLYFLSLYNNRRFSFCFWCITMYTRAMALRTTRLKEKITTLNSVHPSLSQEYSHLRELGSSSSGHFGNPKIGEFCFELIELLLEFLFVFGSQFRALDLHLKVKNFAWNTDTWKHRFVCIKI